MHRTRGIAVLLASLLVAPVMAVTGAPPAAAGPGAQRVADEFDALREKWKVLLDGGSGYDPADPDIAPKLADQSAYAESLWSTMDTTPNTYLWSDLTDVAADAFDIQATYGRVRDLAVAWSTRGTRVYQNATLRANLITALDWLDAHWYNDSIARRGNWWEWVIGTPFRLRDAMIVLYPYLTATQINNYVAAINHFTPPITGTDFAGWAGANRSDVLSQQLATAVLTRNATKMAQVRDKMSPMFDYVTKDTGFYVDGSYLDHTYVPYTLAYGQALLASMSDVLYMLDGSTWDITDPDQQNFYNNIYKAFEPLLYKDGAMDMVRGRNIARNEDRGAGRATTGVIAKITRHAPPADAARLRSMVKAWLTEDTTWDWRSMGPLSTFLTVRDIMTDPDTPPQPELIGNFQYNSMDRTVHRAPGWAFGISKSSKRVQNYELTNYENVKGWYTGDGATYLYNGDLDQFSGNYWPTVNPMRLPGTTTEVRSRYTGSPPGHAQWGDGEGEPPNSWSGGTSLGNFGVSGMELIPLGGNEGGSLDALKSWFMFDDEVVALGAGIKTTTKRGRPVETVIENRRLNASGSNAFTVNGVAKSSTPGWSENLTGVSYAHLAGTAAGADIGYYFPGGASMQGIRQTRTGRWSDISTGGGADTTPYTNTYLTLTGQHGVDPTNASYSYVLLPNKTDAQTGEYAGSPDISVLENSTYAQTVRENTLGVTGYNFWTDGSRSSGDLTSNKRASVMTREVAGSEYEIAVSDPTQENTGTITVDIDRQGLSLVSKDPQVTVVQLAPTIRLSINVNGARGRSFAARFNLAPPVAYQFPAATTLVNEDLNGQATGAAPAGWTVSAPAGTTVAVDATPSATDKSIRLTDTNASAAATARKTFPAQNGLVVVEWSCMEPDSITRLPYFQVWSGSTAAISLYTTLSQLRYVAGNGVAVDSAPIRSNTWHSVKLVLDVWNKRYDLYVDGQRRVQRASFTAPVATVDAVSFATGYSTTPSTLYVDDVRVSTVTPGPNLARAAAVAVSSTYNGSGWSVPGVHDGQRATTSAAAGWSSLASPTTNRAESVTLDFGAATQVGRVDLYPRNDGASAGNFYPVNFTIATSPDGVTWTTRATAVNRVAPGSGYQTFAFPAATARYVRIESSQLQLIGSESRMQLAEVEVYPA